MPSTYDSNPATGERIRWLVRSGDTGGELARLEMRASPAASTCAAA